MRLADLAWWAMAQTRRSPGRSSLAVLGVALGTATLVSLLAVSAGLKHDVEKSALGGAAGILLVSPRAASGAPLDDAAVDLLAGTVGVREALPILPAPMVLAIGGRELRLGVAGLGVPVRGGSPYRVVAGTALDSLRPDGLLLTRRAAAQLGFPDPPRAVGRTVAGHVEWRASDGRARPWEVSLTVVGVVDELADLTGIVPLPLAEDAIRWALAGDRGLDEDLAQRVARGFVLGGRTASPALSPVYPMVAVIPDTREDGDAVAERVRARGYDVAGDARVPAEIRQAFQTVDAGLAAIGCLASLLGALGVAQILAARVAERTAEIGLLKAVGATDAQVAMLVGSEALAIGAIGGGTGVAAGSLLASGFVWAARPLVGRLPDPSLPAWLALLVPPLAMLFALVAAWPPARRAWRLAPAEALRQD